MLIIFIYVLYEARLQLHNNTLRNGRWNRGCMMKCSLYFNLGNFYMWNNYRPSSPKSANTQGVQQRADHILILDNVKKLLGF